MSASSIFDLPGAPVGPFGDWLGDQTKSLAVVLVGTSADVSTYTVTFTITHHNLRQLRATITLLEREVFLDEVAASVLLEDRRLLSSGQANYTLRFPKTALAKLSAGPLEGAFEFGLRVECDGLTAQTGEFALSDKLQPSKPQALDKPPRNPIDCAFDGELTTQQLLWLAGSYLPVNQRPRDFPTEADVKKHLVHINWVLKRYAISGPLKRMHFLAQVLHETVGLSATTEFSQQLGKWRGRGLLQITGELNYRNYGQYVRNRAKDGSDVPVRAPKFHPETNDNDLAQIAQEPHAAWSAGWFWGVNSGLDSFNGFADSNDLLLITANLNGGFNGFDDREKRLIIALASLPDDCPARKKPVPAFDQSQIYGNLLQSFAWGLWHDEGIRDAVRNTCRNDRKEALAGYKRALELEERADPTREAPTRLTYHYGVLEIPLFTDLQKANKGKPYLLLKEIAIARTKALGK